MLCSSQLSNLVSPLYWHVHTIHRVSRGHCIERGLLRNGKRCCMVFCDEKFHMGCITSQVFLLSLSFSVSFRLVASLIPLQTKTWLSGTTHPVMREQSCLAALGQKVDNDRSPLWFRPALSSKRARYAWKRLPHARYSVRTTFNTWNTHLQWRLRSTGSGDSHGAGNDWPHIWFKNWCDLSTMSNARTHAASPSFLPHAKAKSTTPPALGWTGYTHRIIIVRIYGVVRRRHTHTHTSSNERLHLDGQTQPNHPRLFLFWPCLPLSTKTKEQAAQNRWGRQLAPHA